MRNKTGLWFCRFVALIVVVALGCGCSKAPNLGLPVAGRSPLAEQTGVSSVGGSGQEQEPPSPTQGNSSGGLPTASWSTVMAPVPPLALYATFMDGPEETPAYINERSQWFTKVEEAIASCMAQQGFQYTPLSFKADGFSAAMRLSPMLLSLPVPFLSNDRALVAEQGYGVMAIPEDRPVKAGVAEDPNVSYRATLSQAEGEAYDVALYGDYRDPSGISVNSCSGGAQIRFPEPTTVSTALVFEAEFWDLQVDAWNLVRKDALASADGLGLDPRVVQLDDEWEACMGRRGYVFEMEVESRGPVLAMDLAIRTRLDGTVGPLYYGSIPSASIPGEEKSLLGTEPERKVALADFDCRVETDYMARLTHIRVSLDEEFIRTHQVELDRLVAAADSW